MSSGELGGGLAILGESFTEGIGAREVGGRVVGGLEVGVIMTALLGTRGVGGARLGAALSAGSFSRRFGGMMPSREDGISHSPRCPRLESARLGGRSVVRAERAERGVPSLRWGRPPRRT